MHQIGTLLKKIREDKRISQTALCGDFMSRIALSKIENNKVLPKFNTLAYILDQLSITFDEFIFLLGEERSRNSLISKFWLISDNTETEKLTEFISECDTYLSNQNDFFIEDLRTLASSLLLLPDLSITQISQSTKLKIQPIWYRLNEMNLWTLAELKLAACIIFYYSNETALNIASRIENELKKYETYTPVKTFILNEYLNLTTIYMNSKNFTVAKEINHYALVLSQEINRYDIYYFCLVRNGIFLQNTTFINEGIDMLQRLKKSNYIDFLNSEIDQLT